MSKPKKARTASSNRWMQEHFDDEYVKKAQKLGLRSRAVFKIEEINNKDKLIKPGHECGRFRRSSWWLV